MTVLPDRLTTRNVEEFHVVLDQVAGSMAADTATVLLLDATKTALEPFASSGLDRTSRLAPPVPIGQGFAGRVALTRRPVVLDEVTPASVLNPVLLAHGLQSVLGVPLLHGDELLGVLHVGSKERKHFGTEDESQLAEIGKQVAAMVWARSKEAELTAAAVLQRSLLPVISEEISGLDVAVRYLPAEGDLGGDWYDVFRLPGDRIAVVMGDVVGHGLHAAVVMGRLKSALRAYALEHEDPAEVLSMLDRKIDHFEQGALATAVYGVASPPYREFQFCSAGHWPPVVATQEGETTLVDLEPGLLLGVDPSIPRRSSTVVVPEGALLCLFTDGLVERRSDVRFEDGSFGPNVGKILSTLDSELDAEDNCRQVLAELVGQDLMEDDIALLVLRAVGSNGARPTPASEGPQAVTTHRTIELAVSPRSVSLARRVLLDMLPESLDDQWPDAATTAVSEVVTNAIVHGSPPISVHISVATHGVRVEVADGSTRMPSARNYALTAGTGRGLRMLESAVTRWGSTARPGGKIVWFELGGPADADRHEVEEVAPGTPQVDTTFPVVLRNVPLLMHWAWQEHAQALLREYLLFALDTHPDVIDQHAEAGAALDVLRESIPVPRLPDDPDELLADALEPRVTAEELEITVPATSATWMRTLQLVLRRASHAASTGQFLGPPTQPEISELRDWICDEVVAQLESGRAPQPWVSRTGLLEPLADDAALRVHYGDLLDPDRALLAVDEASIIVAVTQSVVDFLGYRTANELLGRRVIVVVPHRFHQAHIAGTTLNATNGRDRLLDVPVTVPVLRADETETVVELFVSPTQLDAHRRGFIAEFTLPSP